MIGSKWSLAAVMGLSCLVLGGCPGKTDNGLDAAQAALLSDAAADKGEGPAPSSGDHFKYGGNRRAPGRDVSSVVYSAPDYGVAFRYPRDYALEEGDIEERSYFLRGQEELEPGATLLATVLIPEDAYPNTTFEHGSLQLAANDEVSREGCKALVSEEAAEGGGGVREITLDGVRFWRGEEHSTMADTQIVERHYTGFANGRCYEFFVVVALGEPADDENAMHQGDAGKVLRQFEKILGSLRLYEPEAAAGEVRAAAGEPRL